MAIIYKLINMKKSIILLLAVLFLASCETNVIGDFEPSPYLGTGNDTPVNISKKGVAFTNKTKAWSHKTSELTANWMYSWGNVLADEIPENVEYVPMFWGKSSVTDENIDRIKGLIAEGKVKYVLGFNEPDGSTQANMSVPEAIALWPKLEELGVPLGSPATVGYGNEWMKDFMQQADALGLRVDFISLHSYGGANALNFVNILKQAHELYNRPIWVTEFAVADWNATKPENNRYTEAEVIQFMQDATTAMNSIDWVERYAWFDGSNAALATSSLFDDEAVITTLGEVYAAINPNENIGPGVDTEYTPPVDLDELIVNGHFEGGTYVKTYNWGTADMPIAWDGYESGIVETDVVAAYTGNFSARLKSGSSALTTVVPVEAGKTYIYKLYSKWAEVGVNMRIVFKDNVANVKIGQSEFLPISVEWTESTGEITIPAGVTDLLISLWNGSDTHFFFDDISLKEKK
jgi:hypothetical protein